MKTGIERIEYTNYHRYKIDGRWAIGVTTALKGVPKDDALKKWAARLVAEYAINHMDQVRNMIAEAGEGHAIHYLKEIPNQRFKSAGIRGTAVHALAEQYIKGREIAPDDELAPYAEGYAAFIEDFNPTSVHEELVVASREHMIAGTLDSIQDIPGHGRCLVDYKTSGGVYGEYALQVSAYEHMEVYLDPETGKEQPMIPVDECLILHIKPHDYELIPVISNQETFRKFLTARDNYVANVQSKKLDKLLGIPLDPPRRDAA
jgi:hypothetical protein